jgi:plasmid stabilization system protein ParE
MPYRLSALAEGDLDEIWAYVAEDRREVWRLSPWQSLPRSLVDE